MANFETSDYAQMRRCRMAHLYAETVNEIFESGDGMVPVSGHVETVRPDLSHWPIKWIISISPQATERPDRLSSIIDASEPATG